MSRYWFEAIERKPPPTITAPATRKSQPVQSPGVHRARQRRPRSLDQSIRSAATANAAGTTASAPFTAGATSDASTAATIHQRRFAISAFAIRYRQSVAHGYAIASGVRYDE